MLKREKRKKGGGCKAENFLLPDDLVDKGTDSYFLAEAFSIGVTADFTVVGVFRLTINNLAMWR